MVTKELSEAAVELDVIFERTSEDVLKKIPLKLRNLIKQIKSETYEFKYDENKSLDEQNLKDLTRGLIAIIYQNFICNDSEKASYDKECSKVLQDADDKKKLQYPVDVFGANIDKYEPEQENVKLVQIKKQNIFIRILNKIKKMLGR